MIRGIYLIAWLLLLQTAALIALVVGDRAAYHELTDRAEAIW